MMGLARGDREERSVFEVTKRVLERAGYRIRIPKKINDLCCGASFEGRGLLHAANLSSSSLLSSLLEESEGGKYPILMDASPCAFRLKEISPLFHDNPTYQLLQFSIFDPIQFTSSFLVPRLQWHKLSSINNNNTNNNNDNNNNNNNNNESKVKICLHVPCGSKKMKLAGKMMEIAKLCADEVEDSEVSCCGMGGDRGLKYPELTSSATQFLSIDDPLHTLAFSTNRTCEISLSRQSGVHFHNLMYLIDSCTSPLPSQ